MAANTKLLQRELRDGRTVHFQWYYSIVFAILHVLTLVAFVPMFVHVSSIVVFFIMAWITGGLGVTLGYHRLLTHRSFVTYKPIEYMLTIFACLSWQGGASSMGWHASSASCGIG